MNREYPAGSPRNRHKFRKNRGRSWIGGRGQATEPYLKDRNGWHPASIRRARTACRTSLPVAENRGVSGSTSSGPGTTWRQNNKRIPHIHVGLVNGASLWMQCSTVRLCRKHLLSGNDHSQHCRQQLIN